MNHHCWATARITCAVLALAMLLAAPPALAGDTAGQVWIISTRAAPRWGTPSPSTESITYWRLQETHRWQPASEKAFLASDDPAVPTVIFVHGNREDWDGAIEDAWLVYRQLAAADGDCPDFRAATRSVGPKMGLSPSPDTRIGTVPADAGRPFRLVIWSWPTERVLKRHRPDLQLKAAYSDIEAYYLAQRLRRLNPQTPVTLIGYSFGTRVITGALHLLAGGQVAGRRLAQHTALKRKPMRAVLVAGAEDAHWLLPGQRAGLALSQVDRMLITVNRCDPVLRWYPLLYRRGGPPALGHTGPAGCLPAKKVELLDVSCSVGRFHEWERYVEEMGTSLILTAGTRTASLP